MHTSPTRLSLRASDWLRDHDVTQIHRGDWFLGRKIRFDWLFSSCFLEGAVEGQCALKLMRSWKYSIVEMVLKYV